MVNLFGFLIIITFIAFWVFFIAWIVSKISKKPNFAKGKYVIISFFAPIVAFILFGIATSHDPEYNSDSSNSAKSSSSVSTSVKKKQIAKKTALFKITSKKNSAGDFETDSTGNFKLQGKANKNISIQLTGNPGYDDTKIATQSVKKGSDFSIPINVTVQNPILDVKILAISGKTRYRKTIHIYNNSDAYSSSQSAEDSSVAASESSSSSAASSEKAVKAEGETALIKAEAYANSEYLSKAAIREQLTSSVEGFSESATDYAMEHLKGVDWDENALAQAKDYQNEQAMSPSAIREQLISSYGGQFTPAQADYAIQHLND